MLALIPARGGSKGVPGKNLCEIDGVSLVGRAINVARGVADINHILVSTDSKEIAEEAKRYKATVLGARPPHLSSDTAAMIDVIKYEIKRYESEFDQKISTLVLLEPVVPFRTSDHVRRAIELYNTQIEGSVISVCPLERKPENIFIKKSNRLNRYIVGDVEQFACRQEMSHLCRLSSGVYVVGRDDFMKQGKLVIEPIQYVEMTQEESINIDSLLDLNLARLYAESLKEINI